MCRFIGDLPRRKLHAIDDPVENRQALAQHVVRLYRIQAASMGEDDETWLSFGGRRQLHDGPKGFLTRDNYLLVGYSGHFRRRWPVSRMVRAQAGVTAETIRLHLNFEQEVRTRLPPCPEIDQCSLG